MYSICCTLQPPFKDFEFPESPRPPPPEPPKLPKNETPSRFWAMVEPYCQEINPEDLKVLEDVLRSHEDDADYYKIPSLGKHYSQRWAQEDILEEQREGKHDRISYVGSIIHCHQKLITCITWTIQF